MAKQYSGLSMQDCIKTGLVAKTATTQHRGLACMSHLLLYFALKEHLRTILPEAATATQALHPGRHFLHFPPRVPQRRVTAHITAI